MIVFVIILLIVIGTAIALYADSQIQRMKEEDILNDYYRTSYFVFTQKKYSEIFKNKGTYGEYSTYSQLRPYERLGGKFLFNVYLPKEDGTTSEIDMLFITDKGIFVIESKNLSGFISGEPDEFWWNQKIGNNINFKFYNPIMQNDTHIKVLKEHLPDNLPIYSIVVFSDMCSLKKMPELPKDVFVINKSSLFILVKELLSNNEQVISNRDVDEIQKALFPYSQVSESVKAKHIDDINRMLNEHKNDKSSCEKDKVFGLKEVLMQFRKYKSSVLNVSENYIFNNEELDKLVNYKPLTIESLKQNGILPLIKLYSYGDEIIDLINDYSYVENYAKR